jgi:glycosyltransferase involved in cell wall biosynthesis
VRILIVSQYFWPEGFRINDLAKTLVEKGVEVDILTGKPNYPEGDIFPGYHAWGCRQEQWSGATVHRVPLVPRSAKSPFMLILNYLSFAISGLLCGAWMLRGRSYDVVFVYGTSPILQALPALFIGWLKRRKVIVWVQDLWPESLEATGYVRNRHALGLVRSVVRWIYRHTDLLLVQSRAFEMKVAALAGNTRIAYYPNSVDPMFGTVGAATLPVIPALDEGFPVVFAGNVGSGQAVEVIVEAATLLRAHADIRFVVLGNGSRWEWMRQEIASRKLTNLHLAGRHPVETMPGLMRKSSALLVTLADQPIFAATVPNKIQAYMASGRPIIACLNGEGARLVNEAGAGVSAPSEDAPALAAAVLQLFNTSPEARNAMGLNGQRYFKDHFDHDQLTDQLIGHLRAVSESS